MGNDFDDIVVVDFSIFCPPHLYQLEHFNQILSTSQYNTVLFNRAIKYILQNDHKVQQKHYDGRTVVI